MEVEVNNDCQGQQAFRLSIIAYLAAPVTLTLTKVVLGWLVYSGLINLCDRILLLSCHMYIYALLSFLKGGSSAPAGW